MRRGLPLNTNAPDGQDAGLGDEQFFLGAAAVMIVVVIGGFLNLWFQGVTTFAAPWPVHLREIHVINRRKDAKMKV